MRPSVAVLSSFNLSLTGVFMVTILALGPTLFHWGWWISWAPFVGVFIARVSRGRTIRENLADDGCRQIDSLVDDRIDHRLNAAKGALNPLQPPGKKDGGKPKRRQ